VPGPKLVAAEQGTRDFILINHPVFFVDDPQRYAIFFQRLARRSVDAQVIVYHAWENYQFEGGMGHRNVTATPMNPVELAGGYFHIQPAPAILQAGHNHRDTRVEVAKMAKVSINPPNVPTFS